MIEANTRITPKFSKSTNFKNILEFLTTYDENSIDILNDISNLDSQYSFILDEIGKTLGVYPRAIITKNYTELPFVFALDASQLDTVPLAYDTSLYRTISNVEYSKILRVFAKGIYFRGTIQEWEDIVFVLTGANSVFVNSASRFSLVVLKNLSINDKKIVEYALRYNSLTVSIDYIGTTNGGEPLRFDIANLDTSNFIKTW